MHSCAHATRIALWPLALTLVVLPATGLAADQGVPVEARSAGASGHAIVESEPQRGHAPLPADLLQRGGADSDGDGAPDYADNCVDVGNADQLDTDSDGYGNRCDADLDNSGTVNFGDLALFKEAFLTSPGDPLWNPDADFDGSLSVNFGDLAVIKQAFTLAPGPSGMSCAGTVACPPAALTLEWPMPGDDGVDWVINNYVDLDSGPAILDYLGGAKSYDGHRGVDIDVPTFREMDNDFPILAAAQGVVLALDESNFDRNTSCAGDWNFVTLGHPNGWRTIYGHLKMNSVVVSVGDIVEPGDTLGVVGSSGCSTAPHVHLEVRDDNGAVVSPFLSGMFVSPPVYDTPLSFMDATLHNQSITDADMIKDPPANATIVPAGTTLGTGLSIAGGTVGDVINVRIVDAASQIASFDFNLPNAARHTYWWYNYTFDAAASGDVDVEIRLNGSLEASYPIHIGPILGGTQQVRHGVPAASYQGLFDDLVANGFRPVWVDGYSVGGSTYFNVIFESSAVGSWAAAHGLTAAGYQDFFDTQVAAGRRLINVDSYLQNGSIRYAAIFTSEAGTPWGAYHNATLAQHQANFDAFAAQGFRAVVISTEEEAGTQRVTALYDQEPVGSWVALANMTSAQYQTEFNNQAAAGRTLAYLNGYNIGGTAYFSAIWNQLVPAGWVARHDLSSAQFQSEFDNWTGAGLTLRFHTGYERGGIANFGGYWSSD